MYKCENCIHFYLCEEMKMHNCWSEFMKDNLDADGACVYRTFSLQNPIYNKAKGKKGELILELTKATAELERKDRLLAIASRKWKYYQERCEEYESKTPKMIERCKTCQHHDVCFIAQDNNVMNRMSLKECAQFIPKEVTNND